MKRENDPVKTNLEVSPEDRVPLRMKIGYGIGDLGANLVFLATLFYVLYYFTDVLGIPPETAGIIVLASKFWDASIDPVMGNISDRTRSRWGKKRPFLLFGAVPVGIAVFLLFYTPDFARLTGGAVDYRIVWALVTYILFCTAIAIVNVPYAALTAAMTHDSHCPATPVTSRRPDAARPSIRRLRPRVPTSTARADRPVVAPLSAGRRPVTRSTSRARSAAAIRATFQSSSATTMSAADVSQTSGNHPPRGCSRTGSPAAVAGSPAAAAGASTAKAMATAARARKEYRCFIAGLGAR